MRLLLLTLAVGAVLPGGCTMFESTREWARSFYTSGTRGYPDTTENPDEEWVHAARKEGRGNRPIERDPTDFVGRWLQSPKARDIERNFNVDY